MNPMTLFFCEENVYKAPAPVFLLRPVFLSQRIAYQFFYFTFFFTLLVWSSSLYAASIPAFSIDLGKQFLFSAKRFPTSTFCFTYGHAKPSSGLSSTAMHALPAFPECEHFAITQLYSRATRNFPLFVRTPSNTIFSREWSKKRSFSSTTELSARSTSTVAVGTRDSSLALAQAIQVQRLLKQAFKILRIDRDVALKTLKTTGDIRVDVPLSRIGGKGLFTKELDVALLKKEVDLCVHSIKDIPTILPEGTEIACYLPREDPRDALLSERFSSFYDLKEGAVIGTSSLRRQAQLLLLNPSLKIINFRGNVQTRLKKLSDGVVDATVLALSGLKRLGIEKHASYVFDFDEMLPAVAQGAIGVQCRSDDLETLKILRSMSCNDTKRAVQCERAFLTEMDGNCRTPIAGYANIVNSRIYFKGQVACPTGLSVFKIENSGSAENALEIGTSAAKQLKEKAGDIFLLRIKEFQSY
ncbi:porphobilinogen deaminase [Cardiosporidium cionae]|uniref:hydroxymethylbilane synthase n=1 Tax=Cardiosporidium cionae TaxID=476202 RepID=A0ABQ7JE86_9APIC|nr:porphobilinogen deaminase [Cardiosporidium cionae]|eukprot:KAF8822313.1 porphobilinogen deaminase [Cardiosporidium cionae]